MFLDSITVDELSERLSVKVVMVSNDGGALVKKILKEEVE